MSKTRKELEDIIEGRAFRLTIVGLIIINAIIIGLETSKTIINDVGPQLNIIKYTILYIFVVEMIFKLLIKRKNFFKNRWDIFDLAVVSLALLPHTSNLTILRTFRILHTLEMFHVSKHMKRIIQTLRHIGLGILNVCFLMVITFYVLAVVGVNLFSEKFPQYFGSLSLALFTNFRLMVFDDFGIIAEPIAQVYPYAWIYFLIIVLLMSFTFINLFIAVVVTALQRSIDEEKDPVEETVKKESKELKENEKTIEGLAAEIQELKTMIKKLISN